MTKPNESKSALTGFNHEGNPYFEHVGLTKREYFAAMAMQGLLTRDDFQGQSEDLAKRCLKHVDALINELNKSK